MLNQQLALHVMLTTHQKICDVLELQTLGFVLCVCVCVCVCVCAYALAHTDTTI